MFQRALEKLTLKDIQALIDNAVIEEKTIEYKRELPVNDGDGTREFLSDVSSFANTSGGDILFGIAATNGVPNDIVGVELESIDETKLRYEQKIRSGIAPSIKFYLHFVKLEQKENDPEKEAQRYVFIIRVEKSWAGPHRVIFRGYNKFFARHSAGKYELDVFELKTAFNVMYTLEQRITNFKSERIAKLAANETPIPSSLGPKSVLHIIPLTAFDQAQDLNFDSVSKEIGDLWPIHCSDRVQRINLDGILIDSSDMEQSSYIQLYRNGIVEVGAATLFRKPDETWYILNPDHERLLIQKLDELFKILLKLGVGLPVVIGLSLVQARGCEMNIVEDFLHGKRGYPIDRDVLKLPETLVESFEEKAEKILLPSFNLIWNSCGFKGSKNFDEKGEWTKGW